MKKSKFEKQLAYAIMAEKCYEKDAKIKGGAEVLVALFRTIVELEKGDFQLARLVIKDLCDRNGYKYLKIEAIALLKMEQEA